ncbi:MAG: ChaN family lipoprotein [Bacteroidota bacterium]
MAQQKPAYQLFNAKGKKVKYRKLTKAAEQAEVLLFGETHNNPICHWLQLELCQDMYQTRELILGAEMFERDNQESLSQFVKRDIDAKTFKDSTRLWPNYDTDYEPVVAFARKEGIPFWATNTPRKYASIVYQDGFEALESLPEEEKAWFAPLPIKYDPELPGYKAMLDMIPGHGGENFPKAQAIKDATMAYSILENYEEAHLFIHLNGTYHSQNFEGIVWYLQQERPDMKIVTIASVEQADISKLSEENLGLADFILCIPETMTKTYVSPSM